MALYLDGVVMKPFFMPMLFGPAVLPQGTARLSDL
jgi:hypothetical protein